VGHKITKVISFAMLVAIIGIQFQYQPLYAAVNPQATHNQQTHSKKLFKSFVRNRLPRKLDTDEGIEGVHRYIIRLKDQSIASYDGHIKGYPATRLDSAVSQKMQKTSTTRHLKLAKINFSADKVKSYANYLESKQYQFRRKANNIIHHDMQPAFTYKNALNGMAVDLTPEQALKISKMDEVAFVEIERMQYVSTDRGPIVIGGPNVWDGTATGTATLGEGVIIGMIDTGVNTDNPSFADIGGDGYDHSNPKGSFIGDCATAFPTLCNDKLIGVRSYPSVVDNYTDTAVFGANPPAKNGEDYNGHGSHTASTAGGNVLLNVDLLDPGTTVESHGTNSSGFQFPKISGVAPHANIISYQVCQPGDSGDTYSGCPSAAIVAAINDAIADGVDVINFSIGGSSPFDPWQSAQELAFLSAQDAGIFVATAAGNSGPDANTAFKPSAWYTAVAASTDGRTLERSFLFEGINYTFVSGTGPALSSDITAPVVYSGDVDGANIEGCNAFATGSFSSSIALIQRGTCTFADKVDNASAAGAKAVVVFDNVIEPQLINMGGQEANTIPSVFISNAAGLSIVATLSTTPGLSGTLNTQFRSVIGPFDNMASFSSRGPGTTVPDVMVPQVSAPGVAIYAAYADQQFGHDVNPPAPADFAFLQGTSMATPHVAGAAALVKATHPSWTPDNIRSALMMTASTNMRKEDGTTPADIFDRGAGRIQVDLAVQAGLVMNETKAHYLAADPAQAGDVKTLNIPSMGNMECRINCSWTRTFTATKDATWNTSSTVDSNGMTVTVLPAQFSVTAGQTQTITVTADVSNVSLDTIAQGEVILTPTDNSIPTAHLPVFSKSFISTLPKSINISAARNSGSQLVKGIEALQITQLTPRIFGLNKADREIINLAVDSDNASPFDDFTDGVSVKIINVSAPAKLLFAQLSNSTAPDMDLYVGIDTNGDNLPSKDEILCVSASYDADEQCQLTDVAAGNYWVLTQNFTGSSSATDSIELTTGVAGSTDAGNLLITGPQTVNQFSPFDLRFQWNDSMQEGDVLLGSMDLGTDTANPGNLGAAAIVLTRTADDVQVTVDNANPATGDTVNFTISVAANSSAEDINYAMSSILPTGLTLDEASVVASSGTATTSATGFSWNVLAATGSSTTSTLNFSASVDNSALGALLTQSIAVQPDTIGANSENVTVDVKVKGSASISAISDINTDKNMPVTGIVVNYTDVDTNPNTISVAVINGSASNISGGTSGSTFDVTPDNNFVGDMLVTVSVTDVANQQDNSQTTFIISVLPVNLAPNVVVTAPSVVTQGIDTIILDGSGTTDPEGDSLTYTWTQTSGTTMAIGNADKAVANILAQKTVATTATFELSVNDGRNTSTASVTVTVNPQVVVTPPPSTGGGNSGGSGGGGGTIAYLLILLPLLRKYRK